jgi:succinyl-CoA synthetase alpha subunit
MSILVDQNTRLLIQGITGREGGFHAGQMLAYGTQVVAGVTPGRGGQLVCNGRVPVFDSVQEAVRATRANASVVFVPAPYASDAILEAADSGIALIVCITEGIPVHDMMVVQAALRGRPVRLVGPNCPGVLSPTAANVGIIPGRLASKGSVGVVSRSGTLTYEVLRSLNGRGIGQSTCVGIGGDAIIGTRFTDVLKLFQGDSETAQVVLIGEIGGDDEELAAAYIAYTMSKPVTAFIAGRSAPPGRRMGHAGAIVVGTSGRAIDKIAVLEAAGARIAEAPHQVVELVAHVAGLQ